MNLQDYDVPPGNASYILPAENGFVSAPPSFLYVIRRIGDIKVLPAAAQFHQLDRPEAIVTNGGFLCVEEPLLLCRWLYRDSFRQQPRIPPAMCKMPSRRLICQLFPRNALPFASGNPFEQGS